MLSNILGKAFSKAIAKPIMAFNASKKAWVHRLSQENFTT